MANENFELEQKIIAVNDKHYKIIMMVLSIVLSSLVALLAWLSLSSVAHDKDITLNSNSILTVTEAQKRTVSNIEEIKKRQHDIELEIVRKHPDWNRGE